MKFIRQKAVLAVLFTASVCTSLAVTPTPSHAAGSGSGSGTGSGSASVSGDNIEAVVQYDAPPTNGASNCKWRPVLVMTNGARSAPEAISVVGADGVRRSEYARYCDGEMKGYDWIRSDTEPKAGVSVRHRVSKLLNMLVTRTAPPLDQQVVNVGTWFWVPQGAWKPFTVTAYIVIGVVVIIFSATAIPRTLIYSPGDGHKPVSCNGPGPAWNANVGDRMTSPCMYTYRSSSHTNDSHSYKTKMSVKWDVYWESNLGGAGRLPSVTTSIGSTSRVFELQALAH